MTPQEIIDQLESLIQDLNFREDISALEAAIDAVQRRKPEKVVVHDYQNGLYYFCPHCYSNVLPDGEITYCWKCGQAIRFAGDCP